MDKLFYGDDLDVLRHHIVEGSIDFVHFDPARVKRAKREYQGAGKQGNLL